MSPGSPAPPRGSGPRSGTGWPTAGRRPGSAAAQSSAWTLAASLRSFRHRRYPAGGIRWRSGEVSALRRAWNGAVELDVDVAGTMVRALAYPALTGAPEPGDRVLLNTSALEKGLGTGGYALVIAVPARLPADAAAPGHLVKARYTPLQACVAGADEQGSAQHDMLRDADDLGGVPVVVADP